MVTRKPNFRLRYFLRVMTLRLKSKTLNPKPPKPQTHSSELESPVLPNALETLTPKDIPTYPHLVSTGPFSLLSLAGFVGPRSFLQRSSAAESKNDGNRKLNGPVYPEPKTPKP